MTSAITRPYALSEPRTHPRPATARLWRDADACGSLGWMLHALIPGDAAMPATQLRLALPGLAGIAGLLVLPMVGAWLRLALEYIEWDRTGISRPRRISGISVLRAGGLTAILTFVVLTMIRAAGDLRALQSEAPVVSPALQGAAVGVVFWALYAVCLSTLRRDIRRRSNEHRMGGVLRL